VIDERVIDLLEEGVDLSLRAGPSMSDTTSLDRTTAR
jgi:hypothetical protein